PDERITWTSSADRTFEFRICRPPQDAGASSMEPAPVDSTPHPETAPPPAWRRTGMPRFAATAWVAGDAPTMGSAGSGSDAALVGRLVHRLFEHASRGAVTGAGVREAVSGLLRPEERAVVVDVDATVERAV